MSHHRIHVNGRPIDAHWNFFDSQAEAQRYLNYNIVKLPHVRYTIHHAVRPY